MENEVSLLRPQEPAIGSYAEPDESINGEEGKAVLVLS
jgi:hypothetical protein